MNANLKNIAIAILLIICLGLGLYIFTRHDNPPVAGHTLDSTGTSVAHVETVQDASWIKALFSEQARAQRAQYDSLLKLIPTSVSQEFEKQHVQPVILSTSVIYIDSTDVQVKVGNSAEFSRGKLIYYKDSTGVPMYQLKLYADQIKVTNVQSKISDDGHLLSTITAQSMLTKQYFETSSDVYILEDLYPHWSFNPYVGIRANTRGGEIYTNLVQYRTGSISNGRYSNWEIDLLRIGLTPEGFNVGIDVRAKIF